MTRIARRVYGILGVILLGLSCGDRAFAEVVPMKAQPFDLSEVRLLNSPFKTAQEADAKYMLSLDVDRLLHNFRVNAGLPSTAQPLGGWESPTCELRGHFVGHYLSGCSLMYRSTGDPQWKTRVDYLVTELGKCQDSLGGGYLSAFPATFFDKLETGHRVWAPYYTIHKIMSGLLDAYQLCGNAQALEMDNKMAAYFDRRLAKLSPDQIDKIFHTSAGGPGTEFGGMSEVLHDLYSITGDEEQLKLANTFDRDWLAVPLAEGQDHLVGLHANTHIPQVDGFARHYQLTGDVKYRDAAEHFWEIVTGHHSFVTGSNSFSEHFARPGVEAGQLAPNTAETCNTYNMLKLTRHLFEWDPQPKYADYYERALYNHILGSIDPQTGMTMYYLSLAPGHFKVYGTPTESFWCCTGTGVENHAKYGDSIYFHDDSTLWVNLYIPSVLTWKEKGLTIRQETRFPMEDNMMFTFSTAQPVQLAVNVRVPYWATQGITAKINGQAQPNDAQPQSYLTLDRQWKDGDVLELTMPMSLHIHHASDLPNYVAVMYGPIVLAGELGTDHLPTTQEAGDQNHFSRVPKVAVPVLATDSDDVSSWLKPMNGEPLTFTTIGVGKPDQVTMIPLYAMHHERYTVYWKSAGE